MHKKWAKREASNTYYKRLNILLLGNNRIICRFAFKAKCANYNRLLLGLRLTLVRILVMCSI